MHGQSRDEGNNYPFSPKTSNTTLHQHLESKHALLYLSMLEEQRWPAQSTLIKAAITSRYTYKTLRAVLGDLEVTLNNLPPPRPREAGDDFQVGLVLQSKVDHSSGILEFSLKALCSYLVKFVVANNQVCYFFVSLYCVELIIMMVWL